jgi:hypothetical protein
VLTGACLQLLTVGGTTGLVIQEQRAVEPAIFAAT